MPEMKKPPKKLVGVEASSFPKKPLFIKQVPKNFKFKADHFDKNTGVDKRRRLMDWWGKQNKSAVVNSSTLQKIYGSKTPEDHGFWKSITNRGGVRGDFRYGQKVGRGKWVLKGGKKGKK